MTNIDLNLTNIAQVTPARSSRVRQAIERAALRRLARGTKGRPLGHATMRGTLTKALLNGAEQRSMVSMKWDLTGNGRYKCTAGVPRTIKIQQALDDQLLGKPKRPNQYLEMLVRCRKCPSCSQLRSLQWTVRAKREISSAAVTWFGTMTLRPEAQLRAEFIARKDIGMSGGDYDDMDPEEQFGAVHRVISRWITLWLKRIRKAAYDRWHKGCMEAGYCDLRFRPPQLRHLVVCEKHQSGLPHYHLLLHELTEFSVLHHVLVDNWYYGFSSFSQVENGGKAAWYVSKYLNKSGTSARARASVAYGKRSQQNV